MESPFGKRRSWTALPAWVALLAIMNAACGAGETGLEPSADNATTTSPQVTEEMSTEQTEQPTTTPRTGEQETPGEPVWFFDHLDVGHCWDETYDADGEVDRSGEPDKRDCDEPHFLEVYGAWTSEADTYPGEDALGDEANEVCGEAFRSYIGADYSDVTAIDSFAPKPTEQQWEEGARRLVCVAYYDYGRVDTSFEGIGTTEPLPYDLPDDAPIPSDAEAFDVDDTDDGDRLAGYTLHMARDEAVESILASADDAGWDVIDQTAASDSVILTLTDGEAEYTEIITANDEDDPEELTLAFYYEPGPLSTYPER